MEQLRRLLDIVAQLRDPETGCPWDLRQDFASLVPYTLEEAYEVADAIERGDLADLREELGDLLLQIAFQARIAEEQGVFNFAAIAQTIADKMVRRHPHVFAGVQFTDENDYKRFWEATKRQERAAKAANAGGSDTSSVLNGITGSLPPVMYAVKLQDRAAQHGFDWPTVEPVFDKVTEELNEVHTAWRDNAPQQIEDEVGDLFFVAVNLARHLGVDPDRALRRANAKFTQRFRYIEQMVAHTGRALEDCTLAELDAFWVDAKRAEH